MLVYDATNQESFRLLHDWHASIKQENANKQLNGIVVANKCDLESKIQVSAEDGHAFAMGIGFEFCEVSALQSRNIDKPFKVLAQAFYNKYEEKIASLKKDYRDLKIFKNQSDIKSAREKLLVFVRKLISDTDILIKSI